MKRQSTFDAKQAGSKETKPNEENAAVEANEIPTLEEIVGERQQLASELMTSIANH